jgi:hypothetical protein
MIRRGIGRVGRPGLLGTVARTAVVAGTATAVSGSVVRHQQKKAVGAQEAAAYEQQQYAPPPAQYAPPPQYAPAPPQPPGVDDVLTKLQQLGDLKERGLLTDAEFQAQKARLLGE